MSPLVRTVNIGEVNIPLNFQRSVKADGKRLVYAHRFRLIGLLALFWHCFAVVLQSLTAALPRSVLCAAVFAQLRGRATGRNRSYHPVGRRQGQAGVQTASAERQFSGAKTAASRRSEER